MGRGRRELKKEPMKVKKSKKMSQTQIEKKKKIVQ